MWDARRLRLPRRRVPAERQPQPLAPGPAERDPRPVRGGRGHLPGARARPLEHDDRRGRERRARDRPADLAASRAAAALALYRRHRGERPVTGLLYTHSHVDHFGGARGVVTPEEVASGDVPVLAPEGFLEHAVSENVFAGTAMTRRATYMYGALAAEGTGRAGRRRARADDLARHRQPDRRRRSRSPQHRASSETVDGIRDGLPADARHRGAGGDELPVPGSAARCAWPRTPPTTCTTCSPCAGRWCATRTCGRATSTRRSSCSASDADVVFAEHHWPRWGRERIVDFLAKQRDLYGYIHDQTLRLLNKGLLAQPRSPRPLELPAGPRAGVALPRLLRLAQPQREGRLPALPGLVRRQPRPPLAAPAAGGRRALRGAGGRRRSSCCSSARRAFEEGDFRWVVELVNHLVFADPDNAEAKELQARALEQLAFGAENATWRNFFLMGARELREGVAGSAATLAAGRPRRALHRASCSTRSRSRSTVPAPARRGLAMRWSLPDTGEEFRLALENGVLRHRAGRPAARCRSRRRSRSSAAP